MTQRHWLSWCWQLGWFGCYVCMSAYANVMPTLAQSKIVPDNTLGAESSIVTPNAQGLPTEEITGGAIRGANNFHSFQEFNISAGRSAYFKSPNPRIQNILARVTGNNLSEIFGTLGTIGDATNLFLINPNGIIFGPNAVLNVTGSFVGTTAHAVQFGNRGNFSADAPVAPGPILTINPSALLFNQISPASITNMSTAPAGLNPVGVEVTGLRVPDGRSLLLVGGNVNLDGGSLRAYEGRIELAGLASTVRVPLNVAGNTLSLNVPEQVPRADVSLTNGAEVNVRGVNGGSIAINAQNVNLAGESKLRTGIESGLGTPDSSAGDIEINATGSTTLSDGSLISNVVQPQAFGKGGNINITTGSLTLRDRATLNASTLGQGDSGRVFVQASGGVSVANSGVFSNLGASAVGNSGGIFITAESLSLNGAQLQSSTFGANASEPGGRGNASGVNINVALRVTLASANQNGVATAIFTDIEAGATGNGGDINIKARSLSLTDGAFLNANTAGQGNGGNIIINASDRIDFDGKGSNGRFSGLFSTVGSTGVGKGGDIRVKSGTLSLSNNALINASTRGRADAGNISVKVDDAVTLTNSSQIATFVASGGEGKAGDIDILARFVLLTDGSQIGSALFRPTGNLPAAQGRVGNIRIAASDSVTLSGIGSTGFSSSVETGTDRETTGTAGNITVTTPNFKVADAAIVAAGTLGFGDGGNITINANSFEAFNGGQVLTNTRAGGKAGTITLNARDNLTLAGSDPNFTQRIAQVEQRLRQPGQTDQLSDVIDNLDPTSGIFANTAPGSTGFGGSIFIDPRQATIRDGAKVSVNSDGTGNAGNITLQADTLTLDNGAAISAETTSSQGGNINLQVGDILLLRRGSQISTNAGTALKGGDGGNININSKFIVAVPQENSNITANAYTGTGGNIQINSSAIKGIQSRPQLTDLSSITASSTLGVAGAVNVNTLNTDALQNSLTQLPSNIIDTNALLANSCIVRRKNQPTGTFLITGNGGLPQRPGDAVVSSYPTGTVRSVPSVGKTTKSATSTSRHNQKISTPIVEPQGVYRLANGHLVLSRECP